MPDRSFQNFINAKHVGAADGRSTPVVNPSTGEVYATAALSGAADVDAAMSAAAAAFDTWRDTTPAQRSLALLRIADAVESRADEFIALECEGTRLCRRAQRAGPRARASARPSRRPDQRRR